MAVISFSREASKEEMGREIDRRGAVIDALTEERDRLKEIVDGTGLATAAIAAERDRLAKANAELKPLLQNIGDGIANMFDQLVKGNWRDNQPENA
jgi:ABC-type transporter Mla subunit MlaD